MDKEKKKRLDEILAKRTKRLKASEKKEKEREARAKAEKFYKVHIRDKELKPDKTGKVQPFKTVIKLVKAKSKKEALEGAKPGEGKIAYRAFEVPNDYKLPKAGK